MSTREELGRKARISVGKSLLDLEPSAIIELYELYFDVQQEPFRFHAGTNNIENNIVWNKNSYYSSAIEVEGFEANLMGRLPRPKVTVANSDFIISNILRDYSDFRSGKFVRIKLFLKYLDDVNFDNYENPYGTSNPLNYISKEKYLISQKIIENKQLVQFELITPFDLETLETATRAIYGRYCYWQYRGSGCNYQGDLICQENDKDFSNPPNRAASQVLKLNPITYLGGSFEETISRFSWQPNRLYRVGDIVYITNIDFNGIKDPPRTWYVSQQEHISSRFITPSKSVEYWQKDGCSKTVQACKKRFSNGYYIPNSKNITEESTLANLFNNAKYIAYNDKAVLNGILPFGGFPGTDKFKYE
jgi:lambda family phage minor tail protein L